MILFLKLPEAKYYIVHLHQDDQLMWWVYQGEIVQVLYCNLCHPAVLCMLRYFSLQAEGGDVFHLIRYPKWFGNSWCITDAGGTTVHKSQYASHLAIAAIHF